MRSFGFQVVAFFLSFSLLLHFLLEENDSRADGHKDDDDDDDGAKGIIMD